MPYDRAYDGETSFGRVGDDALLLHEFSHRTANEIAAATAAVHLAKRSVAGAGFRLLERAADRLEAFGELHRVLARPVRTRVDVSKELACVCRAIASAAPGACDSAVSLDVPETWVDGSTGRRLVLIAAELVANAVRHALEGRVGRLDIALDMVAGDVVLTVRDDGPGMRAGATTSGTGLGGGIVAQLVERANGTVGIDSGRRGTTVRVTLPIGAGPELDDEVAF